MRNANSKRGALLPQRREKATELATFKRVMTNANRVHLKEVLRSYGSDLSWALREKWAVNIIEQVSCIHEGGSLHRNITLATVVIDNNSNARFVQTGANRKPTPRWETPELKRLLDVGHAHENYVSVKSDIYQMGMVLWASAELSDRPESFPQPLPSLATESPGYFLDIVDRCVSERPQGRANAAELLRHVPHGLLGK